MAYLASIHAPSSVRHVVKLRFLSEEADSLVVAKANRLEIYEQTQDGLVMSYYRTINGKITVLQKLTTTDSKLEHLFVGTDRYIYFTLSWDHSTKQFKTEKTFVDQAEKIGRNTASAERSLVDPTDHFLVLEVFEGVLTLFPLTVKENRRKGYHGLRDLGEPLSVRIEELFIQASAFLYPENKAIEAGTPHLAIIYKDNHENAWLQVKKLIYTATKKGESDDATFENLWEQPRALEHTASHVIPVPAPAYGTIIASESSIIYHSLHEHESPVSHKLDECTIFTAWEPVDDTRWLLADDYGRLYFLMILADDRSGCKVHGFQLDCLGSTSRASAITYLGGGYAYIASHSGDCQVIRIQASGLEVVQTLPNIAPILDFTIMDMGSRNTEGLANEYSSGQARIVAGSGAFQDGSLRSVRSGVGLEDLGSLGDIGQVTNLFPLRLKGAAFDTLIASLVGETRVFSFSPDGEAEELSSIPGFDMDQETLLAVNVPHGRLLQCTRSSVRLVEAENGMVVAEWTCTSEAAIVSASASSDKAILSISGRSLVVLRLDDHLTEVARKDFELENQVSCVEVPYNHDGVCLIGYWSSPSIDIIDLTSMNTIRSLSVSEDTQALPRSILLTQILPNSPSTLFIAMADGHVVTFAVDTTSWMLDSKKITILGTQHAKLRSIPREDGLFNVFATCDHPSLIYGSEGRMVYSAVTAENASCVCPFDSEAYPGAIVIASPDELKIALVDEERTTHVQTMPIGETVRRIVYSPDLKSFGLGTIGRELVEGREVVRSHFKLTDEVVFEELDSFELNENEIVESVARADLTDGSTEPAERFIVGTAYIDSQEPEVVRGRILIFEVTEDRLLRLLVEHQVKGACRALAIMDNKIVAALVKTVVIYSYHERELKRLAAHRTSTAPIDLAVVGNEIVIADLMKSISVVRYLPGAAGEEGQLIEIARHYQIAWSTAVAAIDSNTFLEADAEGNLMVLRQNVHGVTEDDRRRLEVTSEISLGEMVNRIQRVNVHAADDVPVTPRALMATVDGSMYLFATIRPDKQDFLMQLQDYIARIVQSPGNIPFQDYRAFRNSVKETSGPYRFVDGDLVERFLHLDPKKQREISDDLGVSVEETRGAVEALRRLH